MPWTKQSALETPTLLFLKVFANEVLTTFEETNVMKDLHTVRTISSGKSAQFPTMGKATAKYHTPGDDVFEQTTDWLHFTD